jgi:hypothetical protein
VAALADDLDAVAPDGGDDPRRAGEDPAVEEGIARSADEGGVVGVEAEKVGAGADSQARVG